MQVANFPRAVPYLQLLGYVRLESNKLKPLMDALAAQLTSCENESFTRHGLEEG